MTGRRGYARGATHLLCIALLAGATLPVPARGAGSIFDDDWVPPSRSEPPPRPAATPPGPQTPAPDAPPPPVAPPGGVTTTPTGGTPPATPPAPAVVARRPLPDKAEANAARKLMREVFAKEIAARGIPARRTLAERLLQQADQSANLPVEQFVLLGGAFEAAKEAESVPLLVEAADALAQTFAVDAVRTKSGGALGMGFKADGAEAAAANVRAGLGLVDELFAAGDFAAAGKLCAALQPAAADAPLKAAAQRRAADAQALRTAQDRATASAEKLKAAPDDPAANLALGGHLCFNRNDWTAGLPLLAKSGDATLEPLAALELTNPTAAEPLANLADGWWAHGLAQRVTVSKLIVCGHAADLYRRAVGGTDGLRRTQIEKRLAEHAALVAANTVAPDALTAGTVWQGTQKLPGMRPHDFTLEVLERTGGRFRARVEIDRKTNVRVVSGTITNGKLSWKAADAEAIRNGQGPDYEGELKGDALTLRLKKGRIEGEVQATRRK